MRQIEQKICSYCEHGMLSEYDMCVTCRVRSQSVKAHEHCQFFVKRGAQGIKIQEDIRREQIKRQKTQGTDFTH